MIIKTIRISIVLGSSVDSFFITLTSNFLFFRLPETLFYTIPNAKPINRTHIAKVHAITHCHSTTNTAHLPPNSRLTVAMAARQGV